MATEMMGQYRPVMPEERLPTLTDLGSYAGNSVRFVNLATLQQWASMPLKPVSDRPIPCGLFVGKRISELSDQDLDRIASRPADQDDVLSDLSWIREQAHNELSWRVSRMARAELDRLGEPYERNIQPWKG